MLQNQPLGGSTQAEPRRGNPDIHSCDTDSETTTNSSPIAACLQIPLLLGCLDKQSAAVSVSGWYFTSNSWGGFAQHPTPQSCRRIGSWLVENTHQQFVVVDHCETGTQKIHAKVLAAPDDSQRFTFCLRIALLCWIQGFAGIGYNSTMTIPINLCQNTTKPCWTGVYHQFCVHLLIKREQFVGVDHCTFDGLECFLTLTIPVKGRRQLF